jgi:hypothetical protein
VIFKSGGPAEIKLSEDAAAHHCNEIVVMDGSEPVKSGTQWTRQAALQAVEE